MCLSPCNISLISFEFALFHSNHSLPFNRAERSSIQTVAGSNIVLMKRDVLVVVVYGDTMNKRWKSGGDV